ncbi:hypothetical protein JJQ72_12740 [Paenibacillus sp. F411]|uniref:hypothetical protein n=1 Tax=Paenibacillus sp. F411 TaxID=2820239 RepID=UPI001AAF9CFB|nr:hypothetical protein [Paenibacillus sp. F411]MBO2944839.1 hypothetical protein [Paenibacillus sp. F411]
MNLVDLVIQLDQLTEDLLSLSAEDEYYIEQLEDLQVRRTKVSEQIELYKGFQQITRWPENVESLFRECYKKEMELSKKLLLEKEQASAEMNKIGAARKARELYGEKSSFEHGAYIDKNK